ncbi:AfsR/SARP family transcriptional regulator [Streptomyces zagrosensis]|uniref:DNA-binding SARP family transcriptional activator n=1 Tax=Streptomyces zagrosensis TaxID=1042984 RepID=A0A7W9Q979_9ACTN|nr:BTAD domain-containing putative transcriptional regulator [Streptomyces zagrosensis]MBB5935694.1 DNA-binding SARP family transcriptional activator [Streptomyces zagrosensis]
MSHPPGGAANTAGGATVRLRLLGPVGVDVDGHGVSLGPQQCALLALLALAGGRAVSTSRIVDALWEGGAPRGAVTTLRTHILHLRRILEPDRRARDGFNVLVSSGGRSNTNYALRLADRHVDAMWFLRLAQLARGAFADGDAKRAVEHWDEALALWSGPALDGVSDRSFALSEAERLTEMQVVAREERVDALLGLGRNEEAIGELGTLTEEHPLRERPHSQLILALYRAGRQADALAAYRDVRRVLDDELGIQPGRALQELHHKVLRADPSLHLEPPAGAESTASTGTDSVPDAAPALLPPVPRQLPTDVAAFTGRADCLRELDAQLAARAQASEQTVVISAVSGMAGVGKTSLAVHWMHRVADRFPDGQFYINLRGYASGAPLAPDEALGQLLRALGVSRGHLPEQSDEKAALYRSLLAGKRALILLDDAAALEQVRPLLPGSPTCCVVVTSRNDLRGLTAFHDAHHIDLGTFQEEESLSLLARIIGEGRVREEPEAAAEVTHLCGHLPLAIRIVAANLLGSRVRNVADVARDLREGDRLAELSIGESWDTAVRAPFDLSYLALPEPEQRLFRFLGLMPGTDFSTRAAAVLAGLSEAEVAKGLDRLCSRSLLETFRPGRFHLHELLRLYGRERALRETDSADREAATGRLFTWYLSTADSAAQSLYGTFYSWFAEPAPRSDDPLAAPLIFAGERPALGWLETERANLLACIEHASQRGPYTIAWRLSLVLHGYLMAHGQRTDWLRAAEAGLRGADADEDGYGQAVMHWSLGYVHWELARHDEALRHSARAEALYEEGGLLAEKGGALLGLAAASRERGQLDAARGHALRALEVYRAVAQPAGVVWALALLGFCSLDRGRFDEAHAYFSEGQDLGRESTDPHAAALPQWGLGATLHGLGRYEEAGPLLRDVLAGDDRLPSTYAGEGVLCCLAMLCRDTGDPRMALKYASDALHTTQRTHRRLVEPDALNALGTTLLSMDDVAGALDRHGRALRLATEAGCRRAEVAARLGIAAAYRSRGSYREAMSHTRTALTMARQAGFRVAEGEALTELACVRQALRHHEKAREAVEHALVIHRETGYRLGLARALDVAGGLRQARSTRTAQRYRREAAELYEDMGLTRPGGVRAESS